MGMSRQRRAVSGALLALVGSALAVVGSADHVEQPAPADRAVPAAARIAGPAGVRRVVAVSLDGLNPVAIRRLGPERTPTLHRLIRWGASTLNARTSVNRTETLPNHTGMVTGRNIDKRWRGHGVEHNTLAPGTVHGYAGHPVGSVFSVVRNHGGNGGLFVSKDKLVLFKRSWSRAIWRYVLEPHDRRLVSAVRSDLRRRNRAFRLVHLSRPDAVGHAHGFMSEAYLDAVERTDEELGRIVNLIAGTDRLRRTTALIVTSDHGGRGDDGHAQAGRLANYRVPFVVWGRGVARGADLYELNPGRADPGRRRPGWGARRQPVRNADVANLALDLLGLPAVRGSRADRGQDLAWR